jgi:hypothetical protein
MFENLMYIAVPMSVGMAFGYTAGGIVRKRMDTFIESRNENPLLARLNISLLFALMLSAGFVLALWALLYSIGGSFDVISLSPARSSWFISFVHLTGYAMGFLGLPSAFGFILSQVRGDWEKKRAEQEEMRTFAAPQL